MTEFEKETQKRISLIARNDDLIRSSSSFMEASTVPKYSYNFSWQGRPIIQYPQDIVAMQEIIWMVKPDLIIETGIAHGGSLIFSASMLSLLDSSEAIAQNKVVDPSKTKRKVLGIDIDIRDHNKIAIEKHPMSNWIEMIEGSSVDNNIISQVHEFAENFETILVCLDSNHTHEHVAQELKAYSPLVSLGSYCVVFDTIIEDLPKNFYPSRPWNKGNNPKTAVWEFLKSNTNFEIDKKIADKLLITVAPDGYLKKIK